MTTTTPKIVITLKTLNFVRKFSSLNLIHFFTPNNMQASLRNDSFIENPKEATLKTVSLLSLLLFLSGL